MFIYDLTSITLIEFSIDMLHQTRHRKSLQILCICKNLYVYNLATTLLYRTHVLDLSSNFETTNFMFLVEWP